MSKKTQVFWSLIFILIFLLSQDYLFASWEGRPNLLGLPNWIIWFGFVQLLFLGTLYFFAKKQRK